MDRKCERRRGPGSSSEQLTLAGVLQFEERLGGKGGQEPAQHARLPPARRRPFNDTEEAQLLTGIAVPTTLTASLPKQFAGDEDHGGHQICSTLLTPRAPGVGGGMVSSAWKARGAEGAERLPLVSMSTRTIDTFTPSSVSNWKLVSSGCRERTVGTLSSEMVTSRDAKSPMLGLAGMLMV